MLKHERRLFGRKRVCLRMEARARDETSGPGERPAPADAPADAVRLALEIRDLSIGGLCAVVGAPLRPGSRLAVSFPAQGDCPGCVASGTVVRCDVLDARWRIAMEFDRYPGPRGRMPYVPAVPAMLSA